MAAPELKGQITRMEVMGNIQKKTIGGIPRIHVAEGELDLRWVWLFFVGGPERVHWILHGGQIRAT